jgi:carbamoylphosphate synthase small subunit
VVVFNTSSAVIGNHRPSYNGQIVTMTHPLIGGYVSPDDAESENPVGSCGEGIS